MKLILLLWVSRVGLSQQVSSASVAKAQANLLRLTVPGIMATDVPVPIRNSITNFKQALILQTDTALTHLPLNANAASIRKHLAAAMPAPTVGKFTNEQWRKLGEVDSEMPIAGLYGGELTLSVKQLEPSVVLIQQSFAISCGDDNVLLAYSNVSGAWKRILLLQSKSYGDISGAFGDTYETHLLKPRFQKYPLLLVVHGTPWCASTMSEFKMDILQLGGKKTGKLLWSGTHGYRRADLDPPLTVRLTSDGFEIRTSVSAAGDRISRTGTMRYALTPAGVRRVEPLATNAADSLSEWLDLPRKQAIDFMDVGAGSLTWRMFQDFTYEGKPKSATVPYASVVAIRACKSPIQFQAEVTSKIFDTSAAGSTPGPAYFAKLRQVSNGYRIHSVSHAADETCRGPNLVPAS